MAIRVKSKKPPLGAGHPRKKKAVLGKKPPGRGKPAKHAAPTKSLLAGKPAKVPVHKPLVGKAPHAKAKKKVRIPKPVREFVVAAEPTSHHPLASKKRKKKPQTVLRFTENTLKDIAALECVRRCFR